MVNICQLEFGHNIKHNIEFTYDKLEFQEWLSSRRVFNINVMMSSELNWSSFFTLTFQHFKNFINKIIDSLRNALQFCFSLL